MSRGGARDKKSLFEGVLVLMPAALITKLVGLFYKIPLLFIVGVEGMAYFLAAYHVYAVLFVLSSTGLPTALSLQIARARALSSRAVVSRVLSVAMLLFLGIGATGTAALWCFAAPIARAIAMPRAVYAIRAISPAVLLCTFTGAAKGYFQGHSRMSATAEGEVLESLGKLGFGLWFARLASRAGRSVPEVAAAAIFGITAGLFLSALLLGVRLLYDLLRGQREHGHAHPLPRRTTVLGGLLRVALPVTLGSSVLSLLTLVDTALISARLQRAGFSASVAHAMYSSYGNLAVPLYNLIPTLVAPITLSLTPLIGAAMARGERERALEAFHSAARLCLLICVPASLFLALFSRPLLTLLFCGQTEAIDVAAPLLSLLSAALLPAGLVALMGGALQANGRERLPVLATLAGGGLKLLLEYVLLTVKGVYLFAAPISTAACMLTVLAVEWVALSRTHGAAPIRPEALFRPLLAALPALGISFATWLLIMRRGASRYGVLAALFVFALVYLPLALLLRAVEQEDLASLPLVGERLARCKLKKGCEKDDKRGKNAVYSAKTGI